MKRILPYVLLILIISSCASERKRFNRMLTKAEEAYDDTNYDKALRKVQKLQKKSIKKLGPQNDFMAKANIKEGKYLNALGQLKKVDDAITTGVQVSDLINGRESIQHAENMVDAAKNWMAYGNYRKGTETLEEAQSIFESNDAFTDSISTEFDYLWIEAYINQGFLKKAEVLVNKYYDYHEKRAVKREIVYDEDKGKEVKKRVPRDEREERYKKFAEMLVIKNRLLLKQGKLKEADSAMEASYTWIRKKLNKRVKYFYENMYLMAQHDVATEKYGDAANTFGYVERKVGSKIGDAHPLSVNSILGELRNTMKDHGGGRYRRLKEYHKKNAKRIQGKESLMYFDYNFLDIEEDYFEYDYKKLYGDIEDFLEDYPYVPENHKRMIDIREMQYNLALYEKDYDLAEKIRKDILAIKQELYGQKAPVYHFSNVDLAEYYFNYSNKVDTISNMLETSFNGVIQEEVTEEHKQYLDALNLVSNYYVLTDQFDKATEKLNKALSVSKEKYSKESLRFGIQLEQVANLQLKIGKYEQVKYNIQEALNILEEYDDGGKEVNYAKALQTEANYYAVNGLYDEAESSLKKSSRILSRSDNPIITEISTIEEIADIYLKIGKYSKTQKLLTEAIEIKEADFGANSRFLINALTETARLKVINGEYTEADKIGRRALNIAQQVYGDSSTQSVNTLMMLAELQSAIGDYENSERYLARVLGIQEKKLDKTHLKYANTLTEYAMAKFYEGEPAENIEPLLQKARDIIILNLGKSNPPYAETITKLAIVNMAFKEYGQALALLNEALGIWRDKIGKKNSVKAAEINVLMGDVYYELKQYDKAEDDYNRARRLYRRFFDKTHPSYVKVISKLSRSHYMLGELGDAKDYIEEAIENYNEYLKNYFPALSEREKAQLWGSMRSDFEYYNTLAYELKEEEPDMIGKIYNNALNTKAILLNSSIKMRQRILNSGDSVLIATYNTWQEKKELLISSLSMSQEQLSENNITPSKLQSEIELLEKQLSEKSELFAQNFEKEEITWEKIKFALKQNEVAVEMLRFRHFDHEFTDSVYYAFLYVKPNTSDNPDYTFVGNGEELESKYLKNYRNSIIYKINDRYSKEAYWDPLKSKIDDYSTIYLSSEGVYNQINLETISIESNDYVIDRNSIVLVSNTKDIYIRSLEEEQEPLATSKNKTATMFGSPEFYVSAKNTDNKSIVELPGTQKEISQLYGIFSSQNGWNADQYLYNDATEARVKNMSQPTIFHIATHGYFQPPEEKDDLGGDTEAQNPLLRTGLLLTGAGDVLLHNQKNINSFDGVLTAYEAMNLNLDDTKLVVLSACETGRGDVEVGEGVYGLQRAFLVAGAESLVMSLFKVSDEATQKLMVSFYNKWLQSGDKRASFIEAKKELRTEYKDPKFWGAFVMIGLE